MNVPIYLDPVGDARVPPGVEVVTTEVGFLRAALARRPLLIRGRVCRWAETFYEGRGVSVRELRSPKRQLLDICPGLDDESAEKLAVALSGKLGGETTPSIAELLNALWPEGWWHDPPEPEFAARWLLWWLEHDPTKAERALLRAFAQHRRQDFGSAAGVALEADDRASALEILWRWLGLGKKLNAGQFPLDLSTEAKKALKGELRSMATERRGNLCKEMLASGVDPQLLRLAAEADAVYLRAHPENLTAETMEILDRFLSESTRKALRARLPVLPPGPVPSDGRLLEGWFLREYLPYREWDGADSSLIHQRGREFAEAFLRMYSEALVGGAEHASLIWVRAARLKSPDVATLLIVLDGLAYPDMRHLWKELQHHDVSGRLTLESQSVAFAPLPTITEVAKPALLKGVKPGLAPKHPALGPVCKRKTEVRAALETLQTGQLVIWSILEPDKSYHQAVEHEDARPDAEGILGNVARKIIEVVMEASPRLPLRIVITTDHGRLLGESRRTLPVPRGMMSRGRSAVGGAQLMASLAMEEEIAYLHRDSYGLAEDAAIVLSGKSFLTEAGQSGTDACPHGGAFPEEVLIPWWTIARDRELLPLSVVVSGRAMVGRSGTLRVIISNPNSVPLDVERLHLNLGTEKVHCLDGRVEEMAERLLEVQLAPWPSVRQIEAGEVKLLYRTPDGALAEAKARMELTADDMYAQEDNPLEDLF